MLPSYWPFSPVSSIAVKEWAPFLPFTFIPGPPDLLPVPSRTHHKTLFNIPLFELHEYDYPRAYNLVQSQYDSITQQFLKGSLFAWTPARQNENPIWAPCLSVVMAVRMRQHHILLLISQARGCIDILVNCRRKNSWARFHQVNHKHF